jgi:uncharacterized protein YpbB
MSSPSDAVYATKEEAVKEFVKTYLAYEEEMDVAKEGVKEVRESIKDMKKSPSFTEHLKKGDMEQIVLAIKLLKKDEDVDMVKKYFDVLMDMGVV